MFAWRLGLDGKDGMGSVHDCLLHRMVFCSCVYGFMGCVVKEVEMEIVIGVRGCGWKEDV